MLEAERPPLRPSRTYGGGSSTGIPTSTDLISMPFDYALVSDIARTGPDHPEHELKFL